MSDADTFGFVPDWYNVLLSSPVGQTYTQANEPPQYILDSMGGSYDKEKYYWNPDNMSLVDRYTGGSYGYSHIPNPALGTDVVTNLSEYNQTGQAQLHYGEGQNPYFGFGDSAQGYNGGDAPNSGMFISADPNAIADYQSHRQDVINRGIGQVGLLVGGTALASALQPASAATGGSNALTGVSLPPGLGPTAAVTGGLGPSLPATMAGAGTAAAAGFGMGPGSSAALGLAQGVGNATTSASNANTGQIPQGNQGPPAPNSSGFDFGKFWEQYGGLISNGVGTLLGYNAANNAVDAQTQANQAAIDLARESRDKFLQLNQPFYDASVDALGKLRGLAGLDPTQDPTALMKADPSYQFRMGEQMRALESGAAARGGLLSGDFAKNALNLSGQYASQEYQNIYNRVAGIVMPGAVANAGNAINNYVNTAGDAYRSSGLASASGYAAQGGLLMDLAQNLGNFDWSKIGK